jgi:hypothetical protein
VRETDDIVEIRTPTAGTSRSPAATCSRSSMTPRASRTPEPQNRAVPTTFSGLPCCRRGRRRVLRRLHRAPPPIPLRLQRRAAYSNVRADPQQLEDGGSLLGYAFGVCWACPLATPDDPAGDPLL